MTVERDSVQKRRGLTRRIGGLAGGLAAPALRKRGFVQGAVLGRWAEIVGPQWAASCRPERLRFPQGKAAGAVLEVAATGSVALMLQHAAPLVIERVNGFFGYPAVARLKLIQAALPFRAQPRPRVQPRPLSPEEQAAVDRRLAAIGDTTLKSALAKLARHVTPAKGP
ncbi:MAG: DUF721 domain-containing protein [Alphaproteobacteria bacterium]|nr:DUF721 domain-containing protein [Alphaproteobacteria bacterium]